MKNNSKKYLVTRLCPKCLKATLITLPENRVRCDRCYWVGAIKNAAIKGA